MNLVVALGGNALLSKGEKLSVQNQLKNASRAMKSVSSLVKLSDCLVLTFGNGPQVGQIMLRNSAAFGSGKENVSLEVSVAESQGQIGFVLEQALLNELLQKKISKKVVNILTHVIVDKKDPAFANPAKPVGPFYSKKKALALMKKGIAMKEDALRGYRVVVASPKPLEILEQKPISDFSSDYIVIACGGGGIPLIRKRGKLVGVPAVIDKDLSSALLARNLKADVLLMLTAVKAVFLNFGKKNQIPISRMSLREAKEFLRQGHFLSGSMQPKILAAIDFIEGGGKKAIICDLTDGPLALKGLAGTTIFK